MLLNAKTLEKLRVIINGDESPNRVDYRLGSQLVAFFNELGFNDSYDQSFPSRWVYTDEKLKAINGTPELDKCLKKVFAVFNYAKRVPILDALIADFNQYMAFDKWAVVRNNDTIGFKKLDEVVVDTAMTTASQDIGEDDFLKLKFDTDVDSLGLDPNVTAIIKARLSEIETCVADKASIAAVVLIGSVMEGMLLGTALMYPKEYNQSSLSPKDKDAGKVRKLHEWTLNNLIDVSFEIGILKQDVKKFSHVVRDFRNYIRPYEQMSSQFNPDNHTALICSQVLKAAIGQIGAYRKLRKEGSA